MLFEAEGKAEFQINNAFYRSSSALVRDLGVLAAAVYKSTQGSLRVLDAMTGCGVRALRYWQESGADWVWANDANPEIQPTLQANLWDAVVQGVAKVSCIDANRVFFACYSDQDYYDLIDVDSFGSPTPYLDTALWAAKIGGLLYLTSTDGRTATGHLPEKSLGVYGAYARCHPAAHEQGLRLIIGKVQQQAAAKGMGVEPIFSLFTASTYRVMLRLTAQPHLSSNNYGFLGYCHQCGDYQTLPWRQLGRVSCPHDGSNLTLSGPLWLENLHNEGWLQSMQTLAGEWGWRQCQELLLLMSAENDLPPYFYTLGEIGRRGKIDIPGRTLLISALQKQGYRATATHINAQAIKTDANLATCIEIGRSLSQS